MSMNVSWERIFVTGMRFARTMLVCTTALAWMDILETALTVEVTQFFMTGNNSDSPVCWDVCLFFGGRWGEVRVSYGRCLACITVTSATLPPPPHPLPPLAPHLPMILGAGKGGTSHNLHSFVHRILPLGIFSRCPSKSPVGIHLFSYTLGEKRLRRNVKANARAGMQHRNYDTRDPVFINSKNVSKLLIEKCNRTNRNSL